MAQSWHRPARLILAALALLLISTQAHAETITGLPVVVDGDSLRFPTAEVRLWGIDAPELAQTCGAPGREWPCGRVATEHLRVLIGGRPVTCERKDTDRYGRLVGRCMAGGTDLSAAMVGDGAALAFRRYSVAYVPQEDRARAARVGIWAGPFVAPWDFRAAKKNGR